MTERHGLPDGDGMEAGAVRERMGTETGVGVLIGVMLSAIFLTGIVSIVKAAIERPRSVLPALVAACLSLFIAIRLSEDDVAQDEADIKGDTSIHEEQQFVQDYSVHSTVENGNVEVGERPVWSR